jgi:hypothetical protein
MGGQAGGRGYKVQWLITMLDSLEDAEWTHFTAEAVDASEKVDILFEVRNGDEVTKKIAKQVKSTDGQFTRPQAKNIGQSLKDSYPDATEYEVILIGATSEGVIGLAEPAGVTYPQPRPLDMAGMYKQAAQLVGEFLEQQQLAEPTATARELIARGLETKIGEWATDAVTVTRDQLTSTISNWIEEAVLALPPKYSEEHDRQILQLIHRRLPPSFIEGFLDAAYNRRPQFDQAVFVAEQVDFFRQQRLTPIDETLRDTVGRFIRSLDDVSELLRNAFHADGRILKFDPGPLTGLQRHELGERFTRCDRNAQVAHRDLVLATQKRWPQLITEHNAAE